MVIAIVIGLQAVGVVLMSAMVIAPAAAARQWTDRLGVMVRLSAFFGALAGVAGALISSLGQRFATGPTVVLCASAIVAVSLLFAPNRGLLWNGLRRLAQPPRPAQEAVLSDLYTLASQHKDLASPACSWGSCRPCSPGSGGLRQQPGKLLEATRLCAPGRRQGNGA